MHLPIHISLVARFEGAVETVVASQSDSALLNIAVPGSGHWNKPWCFALF